jgi:hypothetical protein
MHTVVLLQGKCKSINVYRRAIYRGARRGGKLIKNKNAPFPWPSLPKVYTHYVCFSSFLFPGDLHDSLDILWQPLATCHQGEAKYIGGLGEGRNSKKKNLGHLSPQGKPSHCVCFSSFLFPGNLHDSLGVLWQPLATPEEV